MSKLLQQYQSFKQNPSSGAFSFLIAAKKELYDLIAAKKELCDEMTRVAEQAREKFIKTVIEKARRNAEKEIGEYKEVALKELEKELKNLNELAYDIKTNAMKGDKGKDADENNIIQSVLKQIPKPKDGKDADINTIIEKTKINPKDLQKLVSNEITAFFLRNPKKEMTEADIKKIAEKFSFTFDPKQWAEEIARAMEKLPTEKKLDYDEGLKNKPGVPIYKDKIGGRMGRGTGNATKYYDLSSLLDGATKTFTIPANLRVIDVRSSNFPFAFRQITDYTFTATTLSFTSEIDETTVLAAGATLYIIYAEA